MRIAGTQRQITIVGWAMHALGGFLTVAVATLFLFAYQSGAAVNAQYARKVEQFESILISASTAKQEKDEREHAIELLHRREDEIRKRVPDQPNETQILDLLKEISAKSGVTINDYRPGGLREGKHFSLLEVEFSGTGNYHNICTFLYGIGEIGRATSLRELVIESEPPKSDYMFEIKMRLFFSLKSPRNTEKTTTK